MNGKKEHQFRPRKLPKSAIEDTTRRSAERERALYEDWSSFRKHKRVIADAIAAQVIGQVAINPTIKAALAALEEKAQGRVTFFRDVTFERPHTFDLHPGLNVLGPPYDFTLRVKEGSQKPSLQTSTADGTFGVVATAMAGPNSYSTNDTAGAAGVGLVIVPSDPNRTLTIRPYFQRSYDYACESHGSPTAHCHGAVSAAITGHRGSERFEFPLKDRMLFAAGSDLWDDAHGADSDVFRNPDAEHIVSGFNFYTLLYSCRVGGDSAKVRIGWWSAAFIRLHCRVPFIAVREF
jgi:hypothetical protein